MNVRALVDGSARPSLLGRFVGGGTSPGALFVGGLALGAFVLSLVAEWQTATVNTANDTNRPQPTTMTFHVHLGQIDTLSLVYVLGAIALLAGVGTAITRPDVAAQLRGPMIGVTGGLVGVVVAVTVRLPDATTALELFGTSYFPAEYRDLIVTSTRPGLYFGYAAVLLPLVAVVLVASKPAGSVADDEFADDDELDFEDDRVPGAERRSAAGGWMPAGQAGATGITVTAGEPLDPDGRDVWRA